jgi:hypothetical protein
VRWPKKRWRLLATPADHNDEFSVAVANQITAVNEHYWTKQGAEQAVRFYRYELKLPVKFWIIHMKKDR